jgi:hypothetical protein
VSVVDARREAECKARLFEAHEKSANPVQAAAYVFNTLPIPRLSVAEIMAKKKRVKAPEVYLCDDDFLAAFKCNRSQFYILPEDKRNELLATVFH